MLFQQLGFKSNTPSEIKIEGNLEVLDFLI